MLNTNAGLSLHYGIIFWSFCSETPTTASSALGVRGFAADCLSPLALRTRLAGCALGRSTSWPCPKFFVIAIFASVPFQNKLVVTRDAFFLAVLRTTRTYCGLAMLAGALL